MCFVKIVNTTYKTIYCKAEIYIVCLNMIDNQKLTAYHEQVRKGIKNEFLFVMVYKKNVFQSISTFSFSLFI